MTGPQRDIAGVVRAVRLSTLDRADRRRLLDAYERTVYNPAFPNAEIREDPAYGSACSRPNPARRLPSHALK